MPELPEVEVLVRHLAPLLKNKIVQGVNVRRSRVIKPTSEHALTTALLQAKFISLTRRGKFLLFQFHRADRRETVTVLGHLGMTGRMFLQSTDQPLPKHAAVVLELGRRSFIYEDPRLFGRFTLDTKGLEQLGPEPFAPEFSADYFARQLKRSAQAIKVKLLDQSLVAGVGNIYASEVLHRAELSPRRPAHRLTANQSARLRQEIIAVLGEAIACGSTIPLDFAGTGKRDQLFYYGRAAGAEDFYVERLRVYDRAGKPCGKCGATIKRIVQAARSTFFCPQCQRS